MNALMIGNVNATILSLLFLFPFSGKADSMKNSSWVSATDCLELSIVKFKSISDDKVVGETKIQNKDFIKNFIERLNQVPSTGLEQISWKKSVSRVHLSFRCAGDKVVSIEAIDGKFKSPVNGGFNAKSSPTEEKLVAELEGLAAPGLNSPIPKIQEHLVRFQGFSVTFSGEETTPQPADGPTRGPTSRSFYTVRTDGSANSITLNIFSGQLPPQPQAFLVGKKTYYLLTYEGPKGESLNPRFFMISEKVPR